MYNSPFSSITECVVKVYASEGLPAFYRSFGIQLAMNLPFQCLHFTIYEAMQNTINPQRVYNPVGHVISGGISGAVAAAFTTPLDVCKTLLNTQEAEVLERARKKQIRGFVNAARMVYRLGGVAGFFQVQSSFYILIKIDPSFNLLLNSFTFEIQGLQARVIYQVPSTAICWSFYEFFKHFLTKKNAMAVECLNPTADPTVLKTKLWWIN